MELNEYWSAQAVTEYKGVLYEQKMQNYEYQCERTAPNVIHGARIMKDGDQWCCVLGDLATGVCGFGDTPKEACDDFDDMFNNGDFRMSITERKKLREEMEHNGICEADIRMALKVMQKLREKKVNFLEEQP